MHVRSLKIGGTRGKPRMKTHPLDLLLYHAGNVLDTYCNIVGLVEESVQTVLKRPWNTVILPHSAQQDCSDQGSKERSQCLHRPHLCCGQGALPGMCLWALWCIHSGWGTNPPTRHPHSSKTTTACLHLQNGKNGGGQVLPRWECFHHWDCNSKWRRTEVVVS